MRPRLIVCLMLLFSGPLSADPQFIRGFVDPQSVMVFRSDGTPVMLNDLKLDPYNLGQPGLAIEGRENGKYLFRDSDNRQYGVFTAEAITDDQKPVTVRVCDKSAVVMSDDYQVASARGMEGECP